VKKKRIGLIGYGFIGRYIYEQIQHHETDMEIAFVWNRSAAAISALPAEIVLDDLGGFADFDPDLVLELAHPSISAEYGEAFLAVTNYMILSVTAMADQDLAEGLQNTALKNNNRLFIPHGALIGVDNLREGLDNWQEVTITFKKHPDSLDFSNTDIDPASITSSTVVFDGPVRDIARLFPRNVNTMVTCALCTLGLDKTRAVLISDPALTSLSAEVTAIGKDGSLFETKKIEQSAGVSGTGMLTSQLGSIHRAMLGGKAGINFV
jgi:predicted dinucleotide-utilizing enzyme